jgi:hypothetical protein
MAVVLGFLRLRLLRVEAVPLQLVEVILLLSDLLVDSVLDEGVVEEEGGLVVAEGLIFMVGIEEMMLAVGEAGILVLAGVVVVEEGGGLEGEIQGESWIILHFQSRILGTWCLLRRTYTSRILLLGLCRNMKWLRFVLEEKLLLKVMTCLGLFEFFTRPISLVLQIFFTSMLIWFVLKIYVLF